MTGRRLLIPAAILLLLHWVRNLSRDPFEGGSRGETACQAARASAIPMVDVVHPKSGADGQEIALPGNTQAFSDTPIYARTSGYVKHWYVDIGAHVKQGQLAGADRDA